MNGQRPDHLWTMLDASLSASPGKVGWICRTKNGPPNETTYRELRDAALTLAARLRTAGAEAGDCIALHAVNGPMWTVGALAVWKLGAILSPIHTGNSAADFDNHVAAVSPRLILHDSSLNDERGWQLSLSTDQQLVAAEDARTVPENPDSEAVLIYTSGSTGNPKVVRLSHRNITSNVVASAKVADLTERDRFLALLPFSHALGLTGVQLLAIYGGATIVAPKVLAAAEILDAMREENISVLIAVPRLFRNIMIGMEKKFSAGSPLLNAYISLIRRSPGFLSRVLNAPLRRQFGGRITCWMSGGSRLDPAITEYFADLGFRLQQGYGLSETSPVACAQRGNDTKPGSVGQPLDGVEVSILKPDSNGSGEVLIRGPNVMLGYTDQDYTAEVLVDGWFHSGDIGRLDNEGSLFLTGRSKRLIVTEAGKNVYPEDLEIALERDPAVTEAAVLDIDDMPAAVLAVPQASLEQAKAIIRRYNKDASAHNRINRYAVVEELPRTPLGKIALAKLPEVFSQHEVSAGDRK